MKRLRPNRLNKHKDKKSSGCGLCKPHKHGGRAVKDRERLTLLAENSDLEKIESDRILNMKKARGFLKGMDSTIHRDPDRL